MTIVESSKRQHSKQEFQSPRSFHENDAEFLHASGNIESSSIAEQTEEQSNNNANVENNVSGTFNN